MIEWAFMRKRILERMVKTVIALYVESKTRVKTMAGISMEFLILVGVLCPLLFIIVMDELSKEIRKGVSWELMFADD